MRRIAVGVGALALVLAGCGGGESTETDGSDQGSPQESSVEAPPTTSAPEEPGATIVVDNACDLYDGIEISTLINTAAGSLVGGDDECSAPAADTGLFAQTSITLGVAPAMVVMRNNYGGDLYDCPVVDVDGLGDEAFSCLGGVASSHVVFTVGDHLVIFSAGNNTAGPPADSIMLEAAQQIYANMTS